MDKTEEEHSYRNTEDIPDAFKGDEELSTDEINVIADHEDEFSRKGQFSRIFPLAANIDYYEKFFEKPRYFNRILWAYLRGGKEGQKLLSSVYKRVYSQNI
jgi:hypothetical protein